MLRHERALAASQLILRVREILQVRLWVQDDINVVTSLQKHSSDSRWTEE
jgi:hypothetical protein